MSNLNDDMRLNIEFVKEVERYPCLYNVHDGEYSNKESVDKAWKEIGERFRGLSGNDLKIKWRSVRSSFSRSFRTKKEYYLGPYLNFLLPFSKSRYIDDSFVEIVKNESENYKLDDDSSRSSSECVLEIVETKCEEEDDEFREQNGNIQVSTLPELKEGQSRGIRKKGSRVKRACWHASEWGSASKSLNPRARRSEGIIGLRAPHVRPNHGSGDDWSERVTDGPRLRAHVRMTSEVEDLVFAGEDAVQRLIVCSDREH
ncbi:jg14804 [Pararge aegeria aegeria]|uniref:Jg14804 protein n=1 Tax=Pararge aegeria aegeria TaxID=348720 RepID=A0A8S4R7F2_9NEOP|nr:jg14804 [Pararge aegeria aegeria]